MIMVVIVLLLPAGLEVLVLVLFVLLYVVIMHVLILMLVVVMAKINLGVSGLGEQGWRSGESTRLPPMCPGFDFLTRRHMWTEFVGSLLCSERFFSGYSGFPPSSKTNL